MASREKKQIPSKQFTSKKECPPIDKSTENIGGKTVTSEKKKGPLKKLSSQNQHSAEKNFRSAKSNHVDLAKASKVDKKSTSQEKKLHSPVAKCKSIAKKQTASVAKCKKNTKEPSDTQFKAKSIPGSKKKCKSNVINKCEVMGNLKSKTSMENVSDQDSKDLLGLDETSFVNQLFATSVSQKRTQNTKLKKKYKKEKSSSGLEVCNGIRSRSTPYLTRSDSPIRVLRNGKRRKMKDPSMFDGLDSIEHAKKRRRIASLTKEGTTESDSSIYETLQAQTESDSVSNNPRPTCDEELITVQNGERSSCKDECDDSCAPDTRTCELPRKEVCVQNVASSQYISESSTQELRENKVTESFVAVQSTNCDAENTVAMTVACCPCSDAKKGDVDCEYNLGKTISNRIAELIKRSKISEARGGSGSDEEGFIVKHHHLFCDNGTVFDTSQKQMDSNSNLCESCDIKPSIPASGMGANAVNSKDKVNSDLIISIAGSELGCGSSQSLDSGNIKVGQFPSDSVSRPNTAEVANVLELNFSEVRAAISKKIQNCAKESASDSVQYKDNIIVPNIKCNTRSEPLVCSKELNDSISCNPLNQISSVSQKSKNFNCDGKPAVIKSTQFPQKVKSCKRVLEGSGENSSSCLKKVKMQRRPVRSMKKLQTHLCNKGSVGLNKKSGITKIISRTKLSSIAVDAPPMSALGPELSRGTGIREKFKYSRQRNQKAAKNILGKCPCPDNCNNHLNYSCDVLKSNGVNGKISRETETLQPGRAEILKMMDVFEFRDESDELSNHGKLLNPTILANCKGSEICGTVIGMEQNSCLYEDEKGTRAPDINSSRINIDTNSQSVSNCVSGKDSTEGFEVEKCVGTNVTVGSELLSSQNDSENWERAVQDISVLDTLNELLTLASEMNVLPTEGGNMKSARGAVNGSGQECAQNLGGKMGDEEKHPPEETLPPEETDVRKSLQTESCNTHTSDNGNNDDITSVAVCIDSSPQINKQCHALLPVPVGKSDTNSFSIIEVSSEQEKTVLDSLDAECSSGQIAKCDMGNEVGVERMSEAAEYLNRPTENTSSPDEKTLVIENKCAEILLLNENENSMAAGVINKIGGECRDDQVVKNESTKEKIMGTDGDTMLDEPGLETSNKESEIVLDKILGVPDVEFSYKESEIVVKDVWNDVLAQVEILVEGVSEAKSKLQGEMGGVLLLDGEAKKAHPTEGERGNLMEESMEVDNRLEETLKIEDEQGKSLEFEGKMDAATCTEDVITERCLESSYEGLSQLKDKTMNVVHDAGIDLKEPYTFDDKSEKLLHVGLTKLSVEDELPKLAVTCQLESSRGLEEVTVSECEVQGAVHTAEVLKEEVEDAGEPEKELSTNTLPEPTQIKEAEMDKEESLESMDDGTAATANEMSLEHVVQKEENWESVNTKEEVRSTQSDSIQLKSSHEMFPEYKEIEKLEEMKDVSTLEQFLDGKLTACNEGGGVDDHVESSDMKRFEEEESPEVQAVKESILSALGLQSLRAARAAVATVCEGGEREVSSYTGTLKTVIKVSRSPEKKTARVPVRSKKTRGADTAGSNTDEVEEHEGGDVDGIERIKYSICSESTSSSDANKSASSPEQNIRKSVKLSSCHWSHNDVGTQVLGEKDVAVVKTQDDEGKASGKQDGNLIIPEKSSSFSIHPQRLCSDVCSYCFGKFGSLDTPCHIAQLKSLERQQNILSIETHLTADSCLCDACYRHVDRKANCPSYKPNRKRQHRSDDSHPKSLCCVQGCTLPAYHTVRRKWLLKLKRSIANKVPIDMEKMPQHLPFRLCSQHYYWVDFFMVCGVCKRKLTRNHMYPLGSEVNDLNKYLIGDGIPVHLTDKIFLCKLCRYFCTLRLKHKDPSQLTGNHKLFFDSYRKRILHYNDIEVMDSEEVAEPIVMPSKSKRRKTKDKEASGDAENVGKAKNKNDVVQPTTAASGSVNAASEQQQNEPQVEFITLGDAISDTNRSGASTPLIDYSTLDTSAGTTTINIVSYDDTTCKSVKQRTSHNSGNSVVNKSFYPGSEDLPLHANFDFHNKPRDAGDSKPSEWDKCTATIQFDKQTKKLFQQLQRPYGNHSSFFRHLILLEKYWRSGDLALTPNASQRAVSYVTSVTNRITSFEGHSVPLFPVPPATAVISSASSVPVIDLPLRRRLSGSGVVSSPVIVTSQGMTFTAVSSVSAATTSTSSVTCTPVFSSMPYVSSPSPTPLFTSPVPGSFLHGRRVPNVLQVTAGGKSFSIVPNMVQIKQLQALHRKQQLFEKQRREHQVSGFVPLITDVRSLPSESWEQKNLTKANTVSQSRQSKMSVTILPKPTPKVSIPALRPGVKPSTVVTPTGIILSKTPELSVIAMPVETTVPLVPVVKSDTPGS